MSLELWEYILRTTGGAIEPSKTFWVRILHEWKIVKATLRQYDQEEELWVKNPQDNNEKIEQIDPSQAKRSLGVWQAANGQKDTQTEVLIKKITDWGETTLGITTKEAKTATITTTGTALSYPLATTTFSESQCK